MATCIDVLSENLMDVLRNGGLTKEQAETIFEQGREAVVFALLELVKQLAEQKAKVAAESNQTPATPSGMKPPYQKPNKSRGRKKSPTVRMGIPVRVARRLNGSIGKSNTARIAVPTAARG